jgi:Zyg-11 family protein
MIVTSLPNLTSLDISGTNLAGPRMSTRILCLFDNLINLNSYLFIGCEFIPGLVSRESKPLEYLGLYNTSNEAAYRRKIPALSVSWTYFYLFENNHTLKQVSGDATEEQILTGCEAYIDRVEFLRKTLNDLFHCFRFEVLFHY